MDAVESDLEKMTEQKLKNRADLLARQQKTKYYQKVRPALSLLVHGQVTIIFVVSFCLFVCLFVQSVSQPSLIRFRSN